MPLATTPTTDQTPRYSSLDESSSLTFAQLLSLSSTTKLKPSSHSVSLQIASFQSSHIISRKDVPFWTKTKHSQPQSNLKLETITSFFTVQKWAELQVQRNALNKITHHSLYTDPNYQGFSSSNITHPPSMMFPSFSYFPLLSKNWGAHKSIAVMAGRYETAPISLDTGLWSNKQGRQLCNKDEDQLHENNQRSTEQCYYSGDLKYYINQHHLDKHLVSNQNFYNVVICLFVSSWVVFFCQLLSAVMSSEVSTTSHSPPSLSVLYVLCPQSN